MNPATQFNSGVQDAASGEALTLAVPATAQTSFTQSAFFPNLTPGYNNIHLDVWGDPVEMIIDKVSIKKVPDTTAFYAFAAVNANNAQTYDASTVIANVFSYANWDAGAITPTKSAAGLKVSLLATKWGPWTFPTTSILPISPYTYSVAIALGAATVTTGSTLTVGDKTVTITSADAGTTVTVTGVKADANRKILVGNPGGDPTNVNGTANPAVIEISSIKYTRTL